MFGVDRGGMLGIARVNRMAGITGYESARQGQSAVWGANKVGSFLPSYTPPRAILVASQPRRHATAGLGLHDAPGRLLCLHEAPDRARPPGIPFTSNLTRSRKLVPCPHLDLMSFRGPPAHRASLLQNVLARCHSHPPPLCALQHNAHSALGQRRARCRRPAHAPQSWATHKDSAPAGGA